MAERDPHQDGDREGPAREAAHGFSEVVGDRLVAGEERPGFEDHEEEDRADECRDQKREEIAAIDDQG
jgi:hypothetical protein